MIDEYLKSQRLALQEKHGRGAYSQIAVAQMVGCTANYISRVENGVEKPSEKFLIKISKVYGVEYSRLLAIGGYLTPEIAEAVEKMPVLWVLLQRLMTVEECDLKLINRLLSENSQLLALANKLEKNAIFAEIIDNLDKFNAKELKALKDELQAFTTTPLD